MRSSDLLSLLTRPLPPKENHLAMSFKVTNCTSLRSRMEPSAGNANYFQGASLRNSELNLGKTRSEGRVGGWEGGRVGGWEGGRVGGWEGGSRNTLGLFKIKKPP